MAKARALGNVARDVVEGIEDQLLITNHELRMAALMLNPTDKEALEAVLNAGEPVAVSLRTITAMLSGDLVRAKGIVEAAQTARKKAK